MIFLRGMSLLFLVLGGALLAIGLTGFGDDWISQNVSCGGEYDSHPCAPGEAQGVMKIVGGVFVAVGLVEFAVSLWWSRLGGTMIAGTSSGWSPSTIAPAYSTPWTPAAATPAPARTGEALVDRLEQLAELRDRGALTEAEFQAQKAKLL
jgi:hypothetical protein